MLLKPYRSQRSKFALLWKDNLRQAGKLFLKMCPYVDDYIFWKLVPITEVHSLRMIYLTRSEIEDKNQKESKTLRFRQE